MVTDESPHIAALLERLGRLLGAEAHASGLLPVQWETLRYLARANRFSRHSAALTAYLGSTKGTVSQTLKTLQGKGLILNKPDPADRRRNRLALTAKGKRLLAEDPLRTMLPVIGALPAATRAALTAGLGELLSRRLDARGRRPFGQCRDCIHFARHHERGNPHFCLLLNEKLNSVDAGEICVEQQSQAAGASL